MSADVTHSAAPTSWVARVVARPARAFAVFCAIHVVVWTWLPTVFFRNLPLDLIEALVYGREWQIGYDKLPPLPWWMVEIANRLFGHDVAYYALAQLTVIAAFALVFVTARPLVGTLGALAGILIIDGLHYFNFTAPKFNHDVIELPFWALAGYAFHRALRGQRVAHWALLGFAVGMAMWAKYFVVVLAVPLVLFVLLDKEARRSLATPGPYVALAVALIVMAPHLIWLVQNDFLPFAYAEARAVLPRGPFDHLLRPAIFTLSQAYFLILSGLIALPLLPPWGRVRWTALRADFDTRIMTLLVFGPFVTVFVLSAITGREAVALWGYPLWLFAGVWLVMLARPVIDAARLGQVLALWAIVFAGYAIAFVVTYDMMPRYDRHYRAALYPGGQLGRQIAQRFQDVTGQPLEYVIADMWTGGNVGRYAPSHPRVLIDGNPKRAPWIDLADLKRRGAAVVWTGPTMPARLRAEASNALEQPPFAVPFRLGPMTLDVHWAIVPPAP